MEGLWCDSKANACFIANLKSCSTSQARRIAEQLEEGCIRHQGGHNSIVVEGVNGGSLVVDPYWEVITPRSGLRPLARLRAQHRHAVSQNLSAVSVAAVRVADYGVLAGDVREAAEVDDVGEAVAAGLRPLVAAGANEEVVPHRDRPHRRLEQRETAPHLPRSG